MLGRVKLPLVVRILLYSQIGTGLILLSFNQNFSNTVGDLFILIFTTLGVFILSYGATVLIANIRVGKTIRGFIKEIEKNIDDAYNN